MLCNHNCNHSQSVVNSQDEFLAIGQQSKYYKTVALTVKNEQNSETKVDGNLDTAAILSGKKAALNAY